MKWNGEKWNGLNWSGMNFGDVERKREKNNNEHNHKMNEMKAKWNELMNWIVKSEGEKFSLMQ